MSGERRWDQARGASLQPCSRCGGPVELGAGCGERASTTINASADAGSREELQGGSWASAGDNGLCRGSGRRCGWEEEVADGDVQ